MQYTSSEANKLLKKLNEELDSLRRLEAMSATFVAASTENKEDLRPDYNYEEFQEKIATIEEKIRTVKHAINSFNVKTIVPKFNMTIDQILVYIPQLTAKKLKLTRMKGRLPVQRSTRGMNIIDYEYINFDKAKVQEDFNKVTDLLSEVQTALDIVNNTEKMEIPIEA